MRRVALDLLLVALMVLGITFLFDYATGRATEELATAVAVVDSLTLSVYVVFAVLPRYIVRIRDSDLRDWFNVARLGILLVVVLIISTGGDVFNTKPDKTIAVACMVVGLMAYATIKLVYTKYRIKKNARLMENSKGGSE